MIGLFVNNNFSKNIGIKYKNDKHLLKLVCNYYSYSIIICIITTTYINNIDSSWWG